MLPHLEPQHSGAEAAWAIQKPVLKKEKSMVTHVWNSVTSEAEAGGLMDIQDHKHFIYIMTFLLCPS